MVTRKELAELAGRLLALETIFLIDRKIDSDSPLVTDVMIDTVVNGKELLFRACREGVNNAS